MLQLTNSNLGGGFGAYAEGVCKAGGDFVCNDRNGIHSCRPCQLAGLDNFRGLQGEINRIVQLKSLSGLLDIDGRMGPRTARALAAAAGATSNVITAPAEVAAVIAACTSAPDDPSTHRQIATYVPELRAYFKGVADQLGAVAGYPEAPMPEADKRPPVVHVDPSDGGVTYESPASPKAPGQAGVGGWVPFLTLVAIVAGGGLAVVGYKRYHDRQSVRWSRRR